MYWKTGPSGPPSDRHLEAVQVCQKGIRAAQLPAAAPSGSSRPGPVSITLVRGSSFSGTYMCCALVLFLLGTYNISHILCVLYFVTDEGEEKGKSQKQLRNPDLHK